MPRLGRGDADIYGCLEFDFGLFGCEFCLSAWLWFWKVYSGGGGLAGIYMCR